MAFGPGSQEKTGSFQLRDQLCWHCRTTSHGDCWNKEATHPSLPGYFKAFIFKQLCFLEKRKKPQDTLRREIISKAVPDPQLFPLAQQSLGCLQRTSGDPVVQGSHRAALATSGHLLFWAFGEWWDTARICSILKWIFQQNSPWRIFFLWCNFRLVSLCYFQISQEEPSVPPAENSERSFQASFTTSEDSAQK